MAGKQTKARETANAVLALKIGAGMLSLLIADMIRKAVICFRPRRPAGAPRRAFPRGIHSTAAIVNNTL